MRAYQIDLDPQINRNWKHLTQSKSGNDDEKNGNDYNGTSENMFFESVVNIDMSVYVYSVSVRIEYYIGLHGITVVSYNKYFIYVQIAYIDGNILYYVHVQTCVFFYIDTSAYRYSTVTPCMWVCVMYTLS